MADGSVHASRTSTQNTLTNEPSRPDSAAAALPPPTKRVGTALTATPGGAGPVVVDWDGPDDPENPLNWSKSIKWRATAIVSLFTFISPLASSMVAPAVDQLGNDIGMHSSVLLAMAVSIFILAYAFGPLIFGPLSEVFGRVRIIQLGNFIFCAFNLGCGFAQTPVQFIILRFLAGIGGSPPLAVGGGVLGDMWRPEERGKAIAIYTLAPLLGPSLAPVIGGFIAAYSTWRWVFWSTTIAAAIIQFVGLFFLKETYAPVLLERKAAQIRKARGAARGDHASVTTKHAKGKAVAWGDLIFHALVRPFAIFFKEPIIILLGLYMAFTYGLIYLVLTTIPSVYEGVYGMKVDIASLHYIGLGLGLSIASQINARAMDRIYKYLGEREGRNRPEHRLPSMVPGSLLLPIGLFLYGWTAQEHVFWLVPDIGLAFIGAGMILVFQSIQIFVIDCFKLKAASALAAVNFLRSVAGFGFPLFAPYMYNALGYGKGNSILGAAAIVLGVPAPWLLWFYGERLRMMSAHAHKHHASPPGDVEQARPPSTTAGEAEEEDQQEQVAEKGKQGEGKDEEAGVVTERREPFPPAHRIITPH